MKTNLWSLIDAHLAEHPDAVAFIEGERAITHAEFDQLCRRTVAWLDAQGIGKGDRVGVWLVNRIEWLALFFALARVGATLVSVNTRYRSEEVSYLIEKSGARLLVLQPGFRKIDFSRILDAMDPASLPTLQAIAVVDASPATPARLLGRPVVPFDLHLREPVQGLDESDPNACAILFTTSGTTKGPKLVMHPQRTLVDHAWRCADAYGMDADGAVMLAMLPFCGVFGLNGVLAAFAGGAPVVLLETFEGPQAARLLADQRVTHTFGSDEMYRRILDTAPADRPFPAARLFGFGAFTSSFSEYASEACVRGIPLAGLYGSSEVLALFSCQPMTLPAQARIEGGGLPVARGEATVRIRDVQTGALLPAGQSGEIEISAPSLFLGYDHDQDATAEAIRPDGFFRTGDLGHLRADGTFVYETRMGDAIRLGGFLVNPVEIEAVLKRFEGVADAQVVAVEIDGQTRVVAFLILTDGTRLAEADVMAQMRAQVAPFKVPARVWFVDAYPVTLSSNGVKTQRNRLRDLALARLAEPVPAAGA
ncbi:Acyl-CoA synthetase (plasmid) [Cupriavidus necator H16]|uniref:Long-chain-fatty-acid--CoA ligase n=1 Tax=Cupriavidus necator (strain ATCC 17699 / DSM 428 / KCTC 22496 / NCIMB 10442 / H16 / Stanier 337) TaxID=381666 RepID=Q7WWU4_CUPNH|nr:AMP-binding protein [Cupriavidus necator]AAP86147.1 putative long-chain-fatty-acid-CoA ligase [Cupriavidus necator H16]QCC05613.1 acyl-CoA synthetase [Cupriavidus necator H16]QQB81434.1 AMP-binding protein [Cupriavidus necator]